jgi:hypothetical protein
MGWLRKTSNQTHVTLERTTAMGHERIFYNPSTGVHQREEGVQRHRLPSAPQGLEGHLQVVQPEVVQVSIDLSEVTRMIPRAQDISPMEPKLHRYTGSPINDPPTSTS